MEEEQVEMKIVLAHSHSLLPGGEGKAGAQLQQHAFDLTQDRALKITFAVSAFEAQQVEQIGIAEDGVWAHLSTAKFADLR